MKRLIFLLSIFLSTTTFADEVPSPDLDGDGIPDWKSCAMEDDGLKCEEPIDNCIYWNPSQNVSPSWDGDEDKAVGTACDLDINLDGVVDVNDHIWLGYLLNVIYRDYVNQGTIQEPGNYVGDLNDNGILDWNDWCEHMKRAGIVNRIPLSCYR